MEILRRETDIIQNPALGAMLIWNFVSSYSLESKKKVPMPLIFLVLPILYHKATLDMISSTKKSSGLRIFASKFFDSKDAKADLLFSIHDRVIIMRELTMESFKVAVACKLVSFNINDGNISASNLSIPKKDVPEKIFKMFTEAGKFGHWCASLTLHEISSTLKVGF